MNSDPSGYKSTTTVIDKETGEKTTRKSEPIGTQGGPIKKLFGELPGGGVFWLGDGQSRIYEKLEIPDSDGSTAKWFDSKAPGETVWTFVLIGDDAEVIQGTM